jgi:hypothetical protein
MLVSRKGPAEAQTGYVELLLQNADQEFAAARDAIPGNFARRSFEYVARNVETILRTRLERLALLQRARKDSAAAKAELAVAAPYLAHLEEAIARCNVGPSVESFIQVANLTHAFLAILLANDWQRAQRLASAARLPVVQEEGCDGESGSVHDEVPKMLVATILDDQAAFARLQVRYERDRDFDLFFEKYFNYDRLMELILRRDAAGFNRALSEQERSFAARATDRKVNHGAPLDGCLKHNSLVFDVWAVALANLARHKGLEVTYASDVIPTRDFALA